MPYSFSSAGVAELISDLYELDQEALNLEANSAEADFKDWVENKFTLDIDQQDYLDGLPEDWLTYSGLQFSIALKNRLPIVLTQTIPPGPPSSKIIRTESDLVVEPNVSLGLGATGTLSFVVVYE